MKRLFKQFSFPGGIPSHVAPGDARLDPRGRRARLRAVARLRRGLRQPRPDRRLRRRRRRGRDRAAGHELALEQVPQPGHRRRGAADPAPQRLQDRQPDACSRASATRSSSSSSAATATRRYFVEGDDPETMHQLMAATLDAVVAGDPARSRRTRARNGCAERPALADDRPAHAQGLDRARRRSTARRPRAPGARTRCRWARCTRTRST